MKKVLFTTAIGPYAEQYFNTSPTDVFNQRFSRGCGIFTLHGHLHMNGPHVIAQNLSCPSVVLEYPSREDFVAELRKGYDFLGITSFHNQVDAVLEMCRIARQEAPQTSIVLGGFGAVGIEACVPPQERARLCDHICHGEGIHFMRQLVGDDPCAPMTQSHLPKWGYHVPWLDKHPPGQTPVVVASVGCPNGCDFCGTTEMFQQRRRPLMTPAQVHEEFRRAWRENPNTPQATLLEEDSYLDHEYMTELGRLLREDPEFGLGYYNFYCLSSNRSLSRWDMDELMLTGVSTIFIGVESKFAPDQGYGKRQGRPIQETFRELHRRGVMTTAAWMIGFDFQNPANIDEDLAHFVALRPTMQQLARVCPFPATPMWSAMKAEGRIRPDVRWEEVSFYGGGGMAPLHFTEEELMATIEAGYRRLYETWGATLARMLDVNVQGYEYCTQAAKNQYWVDRAGLHKRLAMMIWPLLRPMEIYAPNNIVRKRMKDLARYYERVLGPPTSFQRNMSRGLTAVAGVQNLLDAVYPAENRIKEEPFKRYVYDKPANAGEQPYRVEYPNRTRRYRAARTGHMAFARFMQHAGRLADRWEELGGREFDKAAKMGNPAQFLAF